MANYDPVNVTLDDRPDAIVRAMDQWAARPQEYQAFSARRRYVPLAVLGGALALAVLDIALGYSSHFFCVPACSLLLIAPILGVALHRVRPRAEFNPHYRTARDVIHTLRDDVAPGRNVFGRIDLTGREQPAKVARTAKNALGLNVAYYRDEWLSLKLKLYDGNMLRLSAIERAKVRMSYTRRGAVSGKLKLKPAKYKGGEQQLRIRLSVNPEVYTIADRPPPAQVGNFRIDAFDTAGGIVTLAASSERLTVAAGDILEILRAAYGLLQRKGGNA